MSVASFVPEIWSAMILESLKKTSVYAGLCNRDYEGEIRNAGDTVHITSISRPTVATYTPGTTSISPETIQSADRTLVISQSEYFGFQVDDVDKRQAAGNFMDSANTEAAYALRDSADSFVAGKYADVATANKVNGGTAVSVTTGDIGYTQLTKLRQKLDEANVPTAGRYVVMPPWYYVLLLDSSRIAANPAASGTFSALAVVEGFVGRVAGFDVFESNNSPSPAGNQNIVQAGTRSAITYADQIASTEAYRSQTAFADVVRGLHLYGAKVVRPDGFAVLVASTV